MATGRKTTARFVVSEPREVRRRGPRGTVRTGRAATRTQQPWTPVVGREYSVQPGVGKPAEARVKVLDTHEEWLGEITFADVRREGFRTTDDFRAAWVARRDKPFMRALVDIDDTTAREAAIARFVRRHAATRVHVVFFEVVAVRHVDVATQREWWTGDVRSLLADSRKGRGDYTHSPGQTIDRDAECVDDLSLARYSKAAEAQRLSFRADLEKARAERKAQRGRAQRRAA